MHVSLPVYEWYEYTITGPVEIQRYRTTKDASIVQFWSEHRVPGLARQGWNTTKSLTNGTKARNYLKSIGLL